MRSMKMFAFTLALAGGLGLAHGLATPPALAAAPAKNQVQGPPTPILWEVSDADNSLFLLGSFHMLRPGDYPLSPDVTAALADAEALLFELSPEEMASPALGLAMAQAAIRTDGTQLNQQLSPELAARLEAWATANAVPLQRMQMTPQVLQMFEPWFAGLLVSIVEMNKLGLDPQLGLDRHLMAAAAEAGKRASGLESGADQIRVFDGMSPEQQVQMLDESLADAQNSHEQIEKLHAAWRAGDADALHAGMAADLRTRHPELYRRINTERNDSWVPRLAALLEAPGTDDTLVVVGALHLLGEDGVVTKLRARGFKVRRICTACPTRAR